MKIRLYQSRVKLYSFLSILFVAALLFGSCQWLSSMASKLGIAPSDKDAAIEEIEYWKDIPFVAEDFDNVVKIVSDNYINPNFDRKLGYVYASHFALLSMKKPRELVAVDFYESRKDLSEERNMLAGTVEKLARDDKFYLHTVDPEKRKAEREKFEDRVLSDIELLEESNKQRVRQRRWNESWQNISFGKHEFERVIAYVTEHEKVNKDFDPRLVYIAAAQGFLRSMDPHSMMMSAAEWEESTKRIEDASFEGIGALLRKEGRHTMIETPLDENQPSYKAGLLPGDLIIKVDQKPIEGIPLHTVVQKIKGPKGTTVVLTIRRRGHPKDFDVTVVRDLVKITNVESRLLDDPPGIGYIKITGFVDTTLRDLLNHFRKLTMQAPNQRLEGLILDLRNNAGGKLDQAIQMSDMFLPQGAPIVSVKYAQRTGVLGQDTSRAQLPALITTPLVVMVNARSASASEIFASAIQDNQRGYVTGIRTYGKGSVQNLIPNRKIKPNYYVKLTIGRFYAPNGKTIQVYGVRPDYPIVEDTEKEFSFYFREENMEGHLSMIHYDDPSDEPQLQASIDACVLQIGVADKYIAKLGDQPKLRPDRLLLVTEDVMRCIIAGKVPIPKVTPMEAATNVDRRPVRR